MDRKVDRNSITWKMRLAKLAYRYLNILQCSKCGSPVVEGYQCEFCERAGYK